MAKNFSTSTLRLGGQLVTTTGNGLFINGIGLQPSGVGLNADGVNLSGQLAISGATLLTAIASTGQAAWISAQGSASTMSGNLTQTGKQLATTIASGFQSGQTMPMGVGFLYSSGLANKPLLVFTETGWGPTYMGPALWNKQVTVILPAATTTQTVLGDTAANLGTLSTVTTEVLGDMTDYSITSAVYQGGGTSSTTAHVYRGSMVGRNGFFFVSKFALNTPGIAGTGTAYGSPSGSRIFIGLTDQALATAMLVNDPAGNRVGLSYVWSTGGTQTTRYNLNWLITSKDNTTEFTGVCPMTFQTGFYRFSMYCQQWPNNSPIYWQLDDLIRASGCAGIITGGLPLGATAMRPMVGLCNVSGVKNIRTAVVYTETLGSPLD